MESRSLRPLGLYAPDGLECREGGNHKLDLGVLYRIAETGAGSAVCRVCGSNVRLRPLEEKDG